MLYREKALKHDVEEAAGIAEYFPGLCIKIGNNVFTSKSCVPIQAGPLAQHLPWLIQTYDRIDGMIPKKG